MNKTRRKTKAKAGAQTSVVKKARRAGVISQGRKSPRAR